MSEKIGIIKDLLEIAVLLLTAWELKRKNNDQ